MIGLLKTVLQRPERPQGGPLTIPPERAAAIARGEIEVYGVDDDGQVIYRRATSWAP